MRGLGLTRLRMLLLGEFDKTCAKVSKYLLPNLMIVVHCTDRGGLAKCNPIAYWTLEDTFDYIAKYKVPHHPLHAKGYPSIG